MRIVETGVAGVLVVEPDIYRDARGFFLETFHAGKYSAADLMAKAMGGEVTLTTVEGAPITIRLKGKHLWVFDQSGNAARITIADVNQSNGVIHVIDKVLMMKM